MRRPHARPAGAAGPAAADPSADAGDAPVEMVVAPARAVRIRVGVAMIITSWLPIPLFVIWVADWIGNPMSDSSATVMRGVVWTAQVLLGLAGLWVCGPAVASVVKQLGWRRLPGALVGLLVHGAVPEAAAEATPP